MNIGLVGYFGSGNYGDELFVELYRRSFRGHQVEVLHASASGRHHRAAVERQDAIIIGGGDLLIPDTYVHRYWDPVLLSRPVYVAGVGVDFRRVQNDTVVASLGEFLKHPNVRFVSARENRSRDWIAEQLRPRCLPRVHSDLVAALPFTRTPSVEPTMGIVVRANEAVDQDGLKSLTAAAHEHGYGTKMIVLGTGVTARQDTAAATRATGEKLTVRSSIADITAEIAGCDVVVSQRFHGCLVSMLMGIPTVGLLCTEKFSSLFKQVDRSEQLMSLDDSRLPGVASEPPPPTSAADIVAIRASAKAGLHALCSAVLAVTPTPQLHRGGYGYGGGYGRDTFLNGRVEHNARWDELSPRLRADPKARLDPRIELEWYRTEIRHRKGREYLETLDRLIDWTPALRDMPHRTRSVVAIPVAGTAEHDHIYGTLSLYAQQDPGALADTIVLVYINYPADAVNDPDRARHLEMTLHQTESAHQDFPQLNLAIVEESFDPELPRLHAGIIGYIARRLYDLVMMSVERAAPVWPPGAADDLLLIRNDADALGMSRRYLERLHASAAEYPNSDVFQGGMRWGTHLYRDYPGYGTVMAFKEALRALALRPRTNYRSKAGTNGSNLAIRVASLAAVGGVGNSDYYGAGGDDIEIGFRIHAARAADARPIRYIADTQIDASGERALATYRSGRSVIQTWDTFNQGPDGYTPRSQRNDRLIDPERFDTASVVNRIERNFNDLTQGWYTDLELADTALRCVIGSRDGDGEEVYTLHSAGNRTTIEFTTAGRDWVAHRLAKTRRGEDSPYGRKLRRSLYGETKRSGTQRSRMVAAM